MRILIADDHPVVRQGLRQMLSAEAGMIVVGEAKSGTEVIDLSRTVEWDIAVLDYNMSGRSGVELVKELRQKYPSRPVLILSMYPEERFAVRVLRAGAAGYLTKESAPGELVNALSRVAKGGKYVSPTLAERLAFELERDEKPPHEMLSDREYRVMWLLASGKTVGEIANDLHLSPNTVSTYRARVLKKMHMNTTSELMRYAIRHELVD
jgi:two-component system, NarL family, invasion response regulator UvrY